MAKAKSRGKAATESLLPLPAALARHHGETCVPAMRQWVENGNVPPVLLFTGPEGIGKRALVHHIAQWLLCERGPFAVKQAEEDPGQGGLFGDALGFSESPGLFGDAPDASEPADSGAESSSGSEPRFEPCGECAACRRALDGNWFDFTEIVPDSDGEGKNRSLKIDQFRDLKSSQGFGAHEGPFRITLICEAEKMTQQAANSVLKLLEEPPRGWIFFLTANDVSLLLPTLVSRCQRLSLKPLSPEVIATLLQESDLPADRRQIVSGLAGGSWAKALALADESNWEQRSAIFRFLQSPQENLGALVDWASSDPSHLQLLLDQLELILSDLTRWSLETQGTGGQGYAWRNTDGRRSLSAHAEAAVRKLGSVGNARRFWLACAETLAGVRRKSAAPLNKKLLVQELLFPWLQT